MNVVGFGVQQWLDVLRLLYWYSPDTYAMAQMPTIHPVTREITGQRPVGNDLVQLRAQVFGIMRIITHDEVQKSDVRAILHCVMESKDDQHVIDVLRFTLQLITPQHARMYIQHAVYSLCDSNNLGTHASFRRIHRIAQTTGT